MSDTQSSKIIEKVPYLEHLSRPRYDSTADFSLTDRFSGLIVHSSSKVHEGRMAGALQRRATRLGIIKNWARLPEDLSARSVDEVECH
jgi:hypothetical protein